MFGVYPSAYSSWVSEEFPSFLLTIRAFSMSSPMLSSSSGSVRSSAHPRAKVVFRAGETPTTAIAISSPARACARPDDYLSDGEADADNDTNQNQAALLHCLIGIIRSTTANNISDQKEYSGNNTCDHN
jgi:hypothetical protein